MALANVIFLKKDVTQPWEYQDHFDGIFTSFSIHELPEEHRAGVLERSYSALKGQGRMVIADFNPQLSGRAKILPITFFKLFERENLNFFSFDLNKILEGVGFKQIKTLPILYGIFQITLTHR
jgi:hypothetical protein